MRILSVVGARPQFVKLSPIAKALENRAEHIIVHTGQHYDELMSDVFFRDLGIAAPDVNLAVGSGKHGAQTGAMMQGLEPVFERYRPDWVLVYGDTNSTLAAAVTAVKLHLPLAHLEAGLRSFNRRMPEEHNRVLTDHASDLCLAPSALAMDHLAHEGLADVSILVGDVMTDVLYEVRDHVAGTPLPSRLEVGEADYYVATLHRAENTDDPERLASILSGLAEVEKTVLLLAHPRLVALSEQHGIPLAVGRVRPVSPVAYPELVNLVNGSYGVITDSGGLQKEAFLLGVPCTTLRPETEWVETVDLGWNVLVASDFSELADVVTRPRPAASAVHPYGTGHAAPAVVEALIGTGGQAPRLDSSK